MKFHLLLDLDDTLLTTNIDAFLPAYFKKLAVYMSDVIVPEKFIRVLIASTQIMYESRRPDQTLEQVFGRNFYPALGFDQSLLVEKIDKFYDDIFPTLSYLTSPIPEAVDLVEWAFSRGWDVSIATDPLFPKKAIWHRLRWAGLPPEKYPFSLISDFHNFHFAKASVSYYPEFLGNLRLDEDPLLMVGDSLERDVLPALTAGLPVFWLQPGSQENYKGVPHGNYSDLKTYLSETDLSLLTVGTKSPKSLIAFLQATPAVLHSIISSHKAENLQNRSQAGDWSVLDIICHLRDVDSDVNINRVNSILNENNPFLIGQSTDHWADERNYSFQNIESVFSEFVSARMKLIDILANSEDADWDKSARHAFLGPTTLRELISFVVEHDRLHIAQAQIASE